MTNEDNLIKRWFGRYPGRTLQRIGAAIGGVWFGSLFLNVISPLSDHYGLNISIPFKLNSQRAFQRDEVSILIIGIDSKEGISNKSTDTLFEEKAENISVLKIGTEKPLNLSVFPVNEVLLIPGLDHPLQITKGLSKGGVALVSDLVSLVSGTYPLKQDRYLVFSHDSFEKLIDKLGGIKISIDSDMLIQGANYKSKISLRPRLKLVNGYQAKTLLEDASVLFENKSSKGNYVTLFKGLLIHISNPIYGQRVISGFNEIYDEIYTNLTREELNSLLAILMTKTGSPIINQHSLETRLPHK